MNGKASKRLRLAASILAPKGSIQEKHIYLRLKSEYKALPLHRRNHPLWESHSAILKRHHSIKGI
jgi:hypothetical protein